MAMGLAITGIALVAGLINQLLIRGQQSQSRDSGQKVTTSSPKPAPADTQPPKTNYQPLSDTLAEQTFSSQTVAVYNLDQKQMIFTKNGDLKLAPASLVKVMTGLVAFEKASMLAELTTVGASIGQYRALNAAMAGFAVGEKISLRDAFYGLILPSGADAAQVLANHFGDWNSQFVEQMNARAKDLNMKSTTFANITGLDHPNQLSTASDIVKLMAEAASQPGFRKIMTTKTYRTAATAEHPAGIAMEHTILTKLENQPGPVKIIGGKSGTTIKAGLNWATVASDGEHNFVIVVMGAPLESLSQPSMLQRQDTIKIVAAINQYFASGKPSN